MKRVLDPLAHVPGIRRAVLISKDGVPITHIQSAQVAERSEEVHRDTADDLSAFAGMATGLLTEVHRSVDPMSWEDPERLVLSGARGTLVLHVTERVTLAVELERGMAPEELRLPMESVLDRLRRSLARMYAFRAAGAYSSNKFKQAAKLARRALTYNAGESSAQLIYDKVEAKVEGMMSQARSAKAGGKTRKAEKLLKTVMAILPSTDQRYREARKTLNQIMIDTAEEEDD